MRWKALVLLCTVLFALLSPQAIETVVRDGHFMIGSLDVCHPATPALSVNGDMPFLALQAQVHAPAVLAAYADVPQPLLIQPLFPDQNDRPPEA